MRPTEAGPTADGGWVRHQRSEVVGSLLRPARLRQARAGLAAEKLAPSEFKSIEDEAVRSAIALQREAGLGIVTDGEQRRSSFYGQLIDAIAGFDREGGWQITFRDDAGEEARLKRPVVVDRLRWRRSLCAEEWTFLRALGVSNAKITLPNAQQAAAFYDPAVSSAPYPTQEAFLTDVVDCLRTEVAELIRLGCTYIQLDGPQYGALLDPAIREGYKRRGNDPDQLLDRCVEMDNAIIAGHPGVAFSLHICRGNFQSKHLAQGGYEPLERVFRRARFERFLLEYDDARSGGFGPLAAVPDDRFVVLGLVSSKHGRLEPLDELEARVAEAERFIPRERLALSPQCGFASQIEGNLVTEADQAAKLALVTKAAARIWADGG